MLDAVSSWRSTSVGIVGLAELDLELSRQKENVAVERTCATPLRPVLRLDRRLAEDADQDEEEEEEEEEDEEDEEEEEDEDGEEDEEDEEKEAGRGNLPGTLSCSFSESGSMKVANGLSSSESSVS